MIGSAALAAIGGGLGAPRFGPMGSPALDEAVVEEIASWQAVFGAKHLALPA